MAKNILILTGSPRQGGNSDTLAEAFAKGAKTAGHTVTVFHTAHKKIAPCIACDTCWSTGHACSIKDGFRELEPLLEEADALVLATPLYWFNFSAQIKATLDRIYAYDMPTRLRPLKITEAALLVCAAGDNSAFDGIIHTFKCILAYTQWKNSGLITVPGVHQKRDIIETAALKNAEELGLHF